MHCNIHDETKECTAFVTGEGVSKGEVFMTEAVYYNTISFNFLEGGVESVHSLIIPPPPSFVDCWVEKGMVLKRLTRTLHVIEVKDGIFC